MILNRPWLKNDLGKVKEYGIVKKENAALKTEDQKEGERMERKWIRTLMLLLTALLLMCLANGASAEKNWVNTRAGVSILENPSVGIFRYVYFGKFDGYVLYLRLR